MYSPRPAIADESTLEPLLLKEVLTSDPTSDVQAVFRANLQREIDGVIRRIETPGLAEIASNILGELVRFFAWLSRIDENLPFACRLHRDKSDACGSD